MIIGEVHHIDNIPRKIKRV